MVKGFARDLADVSLSLGQEKQNGEREYLTVANILSAEAIQKLAAIGFAHRKTIVASPGGGTDMAGDDCVPDM